MSAPGVRPGGDGAVDLHGFGGDRVRAVITTRTGGVSTGPYASLNLGLHVGDDPAAVVENRRRAAGMIGLGLEDLVFLRQSHGAAVAVVGREDRGRGATDEGSAVEGVDAAVTTTPGVGLVVMAADCVPVVLVDVAAGVLGCVHAGWRGLTSGVVGSAVEVMAELGARPGQLEVVVGPAIAADAYQVGEDVRSAVEAAFGGAADRLAPPDGTGRWTFDLHAATLLALGEAGVDRTRTTVSPTPTGPGTPYFSDRAVRPCGRHAALAVLTR